MFYGKALCGYKFKENDFGSFVIAFLNFFFKNPAPKSSLVWPIFSVDNETVTDIQALTSTKAGNGNR